ncbi:MAG: ribosome assembly RNA-binding protein YhbY [Woeseiaceae bacterium]|nr:ribosome assembly RNA-binding protein YhbY [Woeseiaceae bacterium]
MTLSEAQKKRLRGRGHKLKPIVTVGGAGLSGSLLEEFASSLDHHELMKIRVRVGDRETRDAIIARLCRDSGAELIQRIGNVALVYKENPDKSKPGQ